VMLQFVACTVNIMNDVFRSLNGSSGSINDDSKETVQIVAYPSVTSLEVSFMIVVCV
jgi:hypothetical protein